MPRKRKLPDHYESDEAEDVGSKSLWWYVFRGPGFVMLWLNYMFAKPGQITMSRRQYGQPIFEVLASLLLYAVLIVVSVVLIGDYLKPPRPY